MSSEPERPIEKLLRACAKERRDHAGESFELHPVNRRLLQEEIARKFKRSPGAKQSLWGWLAAHWWLKALGGMSALAVVALAAWLAVPSQQKNAALMARNELVPPSNASAPVSLAEKDKSVSRNLTASDEREIAERPSPPQIVSAKKEEMLDNFRRDSAGKDDKISSAPALAETTPQRMPPDQKTPQENAAVATLPINSPGAEDAASSAFRRRYGLSSSAVPAAAPSQPTTPVNVPAADLEKRQATGGLQAPALPFSREGVEQSSKVAFAGPVADQTANAPSNQVVQYGYFTSAQRVGRQLLSFQQPRQNQPVSSSTKPSDNPAPAQVLAHFRVEQSGTELRVIDSDGSIYAGQVKLADAGRAVSAQALLRGATSPEFSAAAPRTETAKSLTLKATQQQNAVPGYLFQVVGTNLSSNQRVVFSGMLTGATNGDIAMASTRLGSVAGARSVSAPNEVSATAHYDHSKQNAHISGTALIGSAPQINIEAMPAPAESPPK